MRSDMLLIQAVDLLQLKLKEALEGKVDWSMVLTVWWHDGQGGLRHGDNYNCMGHGARGYINCMVVR